MFAEEKQLSVRAKLMVRGVVVRYCFMILTRAMLEPA